jgi:YihY family inner membrane protein
MRPERLSPGQVDAADPAGAPAGGAARFRRLRAGARRPASRRAARVLRRFYVKAYAENVTGLAAMVAYNLLLSVFPLAGLALFVFGQVLHNPELEQSVLIDLQELFPTAASSTLASLLERIRSSSGTVGVVALVSSIWVGSSFWGALDTAFCRLYHVPCRSWVQQKRFAFVMLLLVLVFFAATVAVPAIQSLLLQGTAELPLGLSRIPGLALLASLAVSLGLTFLILCVIYWSVPNRRVPWSAVWPGATGATVGIGAVDYAFPFYLSTVSTVAGLGTSLIFVVIVLLWFYVLAFIILAGAAANALRFERHDVRRGRLVGP